jgi:hypothetical protein
MKGKATVGDSKQQAPDKHLPHAFEPIPEVPSVYPRTGTMLQQGVVAAGMGLPAVGNAKCALCGAPRGDRIHLEAEAEADAESPKWG